MSAHQESLPHQARRRLAAIRRLAADGDLDFAVITKARYFLGSQRRVVGHPWKRGCAGETLGNFSLRWEGAYFAGKYQRYLRDRLPSEQLLPMQLRGMHHAKAVLAESERDMLIAHLGANPEEGMLVPGTGGVRKIRWATRGQGRGGGARVMYYYHNPSIPLFLLDVYAKNEKASPSPADKRSLKRLLPILVSRYMKRSPNLKTRSHKTHRGGPAHPERETSNRVGQRRGCSGPHYDRERGA